MNKKILQVILFISSCSSIHAIFANVDQLVYSIRKTSINYDKKIKELRVAIDAGADLEALNKNGFTPLGSVLQEGPYTSISIGTWSERKSFVDRIDAIDILLKGLIAKARRGTEKEKKPIFLSDKLKFVNALLRALDSMVAIAQRCDHWFFSLKQGYETYEDYKAKKMIPPSLLIHVESPSMRSAKKIMLDTTKSDKERKQAAKDYLKKEIRKRGRGIGNSVGPEEMRKRLWILKKDLRRFKMDSLFGSSI